MKKIVCYIIIFSFCLFLVGCSSNNDNTNENSNSDFETSRLNTQINVENNTEQNGKNNNIVELEKHIHDTEPVEEEIASFSTKLGGRNTPRSRNIGVTTGILNETIVEPDATFSFCGTVGNPTAENGYEKADSFNAEGETVKTYGGGNCQVSSTLYNAVLKVPELKVTERHAHIKPVHYVEKDKDATVAYGSVDFKFKNTTKNKIKIYATSDLNSVNIRIVKF